MKTKIFALGTCLLALVLMTPGALASEAIDDGQESVQESARPIISAGVFAYVCAGSSCVGAGAYVWAWIS